MIPLIHIQSQAPVQAPVAAQGLSKSSLAELVKLVPPPPDRLNNSSSEVTSRVLTLDALATEIDRRLAELQKEHATLHAELKASPPLTADTQSPEIQALNGCLHDAEFEAAQKDYSENTLKIVKDMQALKLDKRASDGMMSAFMADSTVESAKNNTPPQDRGGTLRVEYPTPRTSIEKLASLSAEYLPVYSKFKGAFEAHELKFAASSDRRHNTDTNKLADYLCQAIQLRDLNALKMLVQIQSGWFIVASRY